MQIETQFDFVHQISGRTVIFKVVGLKVLRHRIS